MSPRHRRRVGLGVAALAALVAGSAGPARGHALDPSLLELVETPDAVEVTWRSPVARLPGRLVTPVLPCSPLPAAGSPSSGGAAAGDGLAASLGLPEAASSTVTPDSRTFIHRWRLDCGGSGLAGRQIAVDGLGPQSPEVLLRWVDAHGRSEQRVLDAREPSVRLPGQPSGLSILSSYLVLGVEHILGGFDHLAFVLALVLLVPGRRRLVLTLTAFTVGHSLTLALVVLDAVRVPSSLVEIAIAASILTLAVELAVRGRPGGLGSPEGKPAAGGPFARRPWLMAGAFGLLHGCGFAGALREVGLPAGEVPIALLSFNVGIELGQVAFVLVLWALAWAASWAARWAAGRAPAATASAAEQSPPAPRHPAWPIAETLTIYLLGTLSAYWTLERLTGLLF